MRLPFPEHIALRYAVGFATLLSVAQLLQGTPSLFSLCCFLFIVIATLAFNLAGGFSRASGAYVFFYAVLAVIVGLFWKAFLGEPANSNLAQPLLTIQIALGGITAMFVAVFLSQKITARRAFLGSMLTDANMYRAAIGCMIAGLVLTVIFVVVPYDSGSILSALAQLNRFLPMAIILGTIYQIRKSGGTSSVNVVVLVCCAVSFASGLIGFSKQGMFTAPVCWIIAAASQRYRVSFLQIAGIILAAIFTLYYLVPYAQWGRNYMTESASENIETSISLLSDLEHVRQQYEQTSVAQRNENAPAYFDSSQGLFDRLQMLSMDDALINVTEQNGPFGFSPIIIYFGNLVPRFLWPEKPRVAFGNLYAHEIGMIGLEDWTTGVSFSPMGEAFHLGRWVGIFVVAPVLWTMLFTLIDSLCGDVRKAPWGLLAVVLFAHIAPEGMLGGVIYVLWYGVGGIVFAAFAAAYVMPVLGSIFAGRERIQLRRVTPIRSLPRRLPPIQASRSPGQ